jgi:hypothetical protein
LSATNQRPLLAVRRHRRDSTERPLDHAQQPARLERSVWIVEEPFSAFERPTESDPLQPVAL